MSHLKGNTRHIYEVFQMGKPDTWCKYCVAGFRENPLHIDPLNRNTLHDYVVVHGLGQPTRKGYEVGRMLLASGMDYATAATEIIARGLVK